MQEIKIKVEGMVCSGCENRIKNALQTIEGVEEVDANHNTGVVTIKTNQENIESYVKNKIEEIGFTVIGEI